MTSTLPLIVPHVDPGKSVEQVMRDHLNQVWATVTEAAAAICQATGDGLPDIIEFEVISGEIYVASKGPGTAEGLASGLCQCARFETGPEFFVTIALGLDQLQATAPASLTGLRAVPWLMLGRVAAHEAAHVICGVSGRPYHDESAGHAETQRTLEKLCGLDAGWDAIRMAAFASGRSVTIPTPAVPLSAADLLQAASLLPV